MKLPDVVSYKKNWPLSLKILEDQVSEYLASKNISIEKIWFADIEFIFPERLRSVEEIYVVLFGGYLERIFESGNWPSKKYHFICLSSKVKRVVVELLGLNPDSISVIARENLFPVSSQFLDFNTKSKLHLFYSGRISSQKNCELILYSAYVLKNDYKLDIEVHFFGNFDNTAPKHRGRFVLESYESDFKKIVRNLNLENIVKWYPDLDSKKWQDLIPSNSLALNFSTYICEDFGVSLAQIQGKGIPMVISKWGGHSDIAGDNVIKIDYIKLAETFTASHDDYLECAKYISKKIVAKEFVEICDENKIDGQHRFGDIFLSLWDLHDLRLHNIKKYGYEVFLLGQDKMSIFSSTENGKMFFSSLIEIYTE